MIVFSLGIHFHHTPAAGPSFSPPSHPDHVIPVKVLQSMQAHGDMDTDWARADLPKNFLDFRYNFSGYILSSRLLLVGMPPEAVADDDALLDRLRLLSCLYSAATLAICFLLLARQLNLGYAIFGTLAVALVPQLLQDAHYARPEALSTLLFTGCFALASLRPRTRPLQWILPVTIAVVCGFLTTIKFTYAIAGLLALAPALPLLGEAGMRNPAVIAKSPKIVGALAMGYLAGFALGAPHALLDPSGFLQGIQALQHQYGGGHPPHMKMGGGIAGQTWLIWTYYTAVLGLPMLLLHLAGYAGKRLAPVKFAYAAILAVTLAGFLLQKVFFERNFSMLLPAFVVIATVGIANIRGKLDELFATGSAAKKVIPVIAASLLCTAMTFQSLPIALKLLRHFTPAGQTALLEERSSATREAITAIGATRVEKLAYGQVFASEYPPPSTECVLFAMEDFNDDWSSRYLEEMPDTFSIAARIPSDFEAVPVSTLQTYHSPATHLFYDTRACKSADRP